MEYGSIKTYIEEVWLLPYLSIGGNRETFWHLTPREIMIDFKAHRNRVNEQLQLAWINGFYVKQAIQSSVMICALADKRAINNMPKYPDMPKTEEKEEMNEIQIEAKRQSLIAKMNLWTRANNKRFEKDKKEV